MADARRGSGRDVDGGLREDLADLPARLAGSLEGREHAVRAIGGDREEQAAGGLRLRDERGQRGRYRGVDSEARAQDVVHVAAVALHAAAEVARIRQGQRARQQWQAARRQHEPGARRGDHLERVPEQAEAGDVGGAGGAMLARHARRHAIEPQHALHRALEHLRRGLVVLRRRRDHAGAERLGQEDAVARTQAPLDEDTIRMHAPGHAEPILRLGIDHGVAAGDDAARLGDLLRAAAEDVRDDGLVEVAREAGDREREEHLAAHGVHVGHCIDCGDRAPRPRVVHHGREEVDRLHDGEVRRHAIDGGVVRGAEADEQVALRLGRQPGRPLQPRQHLLEISRSHLGRSAGAGGVRRQTDPLAGVHGGILRLTTGRSVGWDSTKARKAWASGERLRSRWVTTWNARVTLRSRTFTQASSRARHSSSTASRETNDTPSPARIACFTAWVEAISPTTWKASRPVPSSFSPLSSVSREPEPRSRRISGSLLTSSTETVLRDTQGCSGGTTSTRSSSISGRDSSAREDGSAPTTPISTWPCSTQSCTSRLAPMRSESETSGYFRRKAPISAGSTYSPGMLEPPSTSSPLTRPWNCSIA